MYVQNRNRLTDRENKLVVTYKIVTKQTGEREGQIRGIGITDTNYCI